LPSTSISPCIHGWMAHRQNSLVPGGALNTAEIVGAGRPSSDGARNSQSEVILSLRTDGGMKPVRGRRGCLSAHHDLGCATPGGFGTSTSATVSPDGHSVLHRLRAFTGTDHVSPLAWRGPPGCAGRPVGTARSVVA
jgi:hypothetical protein